VDSIRHIARVFSIARALARHDALFILKTAGIEPMAVWVAGLLGHKKSTLRPGQRLSGALQEMGPSFIKLGQMLATRPDLLGEEIAADLSHLQDKLPPFAANLAHSAIETEFGKPLNEIFSKFDDTPVAAASIAQVHFAVTPTGQEVAVKVLRPGIEQSFQNDLDLFFWAAKLIEKTRPELRRLKPIEVVKTLARSVEMEMDLRFEAAAASELQDNFADDKSFIVPDVDWSTTAKRVLTTSRVHGVSIVDIAAIKKAGLDPLDILEKSASSFFMQVFRDGFFHADMHPGNVFVTPQGALAVVDFGIMGRLDKSTRRHLAELLMAFLMRDYRRAAEVHFEAGWIPLGQSVDEFTQACRSIAEPVLDKPQNEISIATLLGQLFQITETFEMETQPQLLLLQKTMLVAEGTGRKLAPEANMWFIARPLIEGWMRENLGPEARIKEAANEGAAMLKRLPRLVRGMEKALADFEKGGLKLHPDTVKAMRGGRGGVPKKNGIALGLLALVLGIGIIALAL